MAIHTTDIAMLPDGRMDAVNAAKYCGLSPHTLAAMRKRGAGPLYVKLGKIYYYKDDLDAWIKSRYQRQTDQTAS